MIYFPFHEGVKNLKIIIIANLHIAGVQTSSVARTVASQSQSDLRPQVLTSSTGTQSGGHQAGHQAGQPAPGVWRKAESMSQLTNAKPAAPAPDQPRKREKSEGGGNKDYNKHWLIQEAEQRRISEAKQRQMEPNMEKMENINNNIGPEYPGGKRAQNNVSDNIYANVDVGSMNTNTNYR